MSLLWNCSICQSTIFRYPTQKLNYEVSPKKKNGNKCLWKAGADFLLLLDLQWILKSQHFCPSFLLGFAWSWFSSHSRQAEFTTEPKHRFERNCSGFSHSKPIRERIEWLIMKLTRAILESVEVGMTALLVVASVLISFHQVEPEHEALMKSGRRNHSHNQTYSLLVPEQKHFEFYDGSYWVILGHQLYMII